MCFLHCGSIWLVLQRAHSAIGRQQVKCSSIEFVNIIPPLGQTCGQYMDAYIARAGGYLTNPNSTSSCDFCSVRTTDELMGANFDIFYNHHWRDFGLLMVYVMFNVRSFVFESWSSYMDWLFSITNLGFLHFCSDVFIPHSHWEYYPIFQTIQEGIKKNLRRYFSRTYDPPNVDRYVTDE